MIKLKSILIEDCWKGYKQIGMKKKGKKIVPNCVPIEEELIDEIGEGSLKPYKWKEVDQEGRFIYIRFTTDKGTEYEVDLEYMEMDDPEDEDMASTAMGIEFMAKRVGDDGYSSKLTTNEGDALKIMSTVADIVKKYLKNRIFKDAEYILYAPSKKPGEEGTGNQRDKMYQKFVTHAIPGAKVINYPDNPNWVVIKIK